MGHSTRAEAEAARHEAGWQVAVDLDSNESEAGCVWIAKHGENSFVHIGALPAK